MIRGELSNKPAGICAVDFRILIALSKPYVWFAKYLPEMLFHKSFERRMRNALPFKIGAKAWLETNYETRIVVFSVGVPLLGRAIDMVVGDYIAETEHFDTRDELRDWIRLTPQVYKVLTSDRKDVGVNDDIVTFFTGWHTKA